MTIRRWLLPLLLLSTTPATAGTWKEATSTHFQAYSDGSRQVLVKFVTRLERLDLLLRGFTGKNPESSPVRIKILLLDDEKEVQKLIGRGNSGVLGFYTAPLEGPFMVVDRIGDREEFGISGESILYHEYAHHFMAQLGAFSYPAWYQEGFADYVGATTLDKSAAEIGRVAMGRIPDLGYGKWLPMEKLMTSGHRGLTSAQVSMLYAQGWLFVHYLFSDADRNLQLRDYLTRTNGGEEPAEAVKAAFGKDFEALGKDLRAYFDTADLTYRKIKGIDFPEASITVRDLPDAEGKFVYADFWTKLRDPGQAAAEDMLASVRAATKDDPSPRAQIILARAELVDGAPEKAEQLVDAALAAEPDNRAAQILKGRVAIARAREAKHDEAKEILSAARPHILRANKSDPNDPVPLYLYYKSYDMSGGTLSQGAQNALLRANVLLPQDKEIAFRAAEIWMDRHDYGNAQLILQPIANSAHDESASEFAKEMIEEAIKKQAELQSRTK